METGIQSSFIPHETAERAVAQVRGKSGVSELLFLISLVLFVASGALAAGVFVYDQYLGTSSASKLDQLQRAKAAFEPSLIQELTRLDDRMSAAGHLLGSHIAPSAFFGALEQTTLETVSFRTLEFNANDPVKMSIKMAGVARSVNSIALQADLMSKAGFVTSPIFSDIDRNVDGVHFNLTALVSPSSINYVQDLANISQTAGAGAIFTPQGAPQTASPTQTAPQTQPQTTESEASPFEAGAGAGSAQ
jgi:hypothetical protein